MEYLRTLLFPNKQFSFQSLFVELMFFLPIVPPTEKATKHCVAKLQAKQESSDL
jgi:hypothetical protein